MRYPPINPKFFVSNRERLNKLLLPYSLAIVNANDILPTNADGTMLLRQNSDLFYLTGIEQEETMLLLYPNAHEEDQREILFLRQPTPHAETWEGHKLTKEEAKKMSGVARVEWLSDFRQLFHRLMCESDHVYLNSNEHKRARIEVETRDARFVQDVQNHYPLHNYQRLARIMHRLRAVKSEQEIALIRKACAITEAGFRRVCRLAKPGINEMEIEAAFAHEFIRRGGRFACDLLLLDVAASYANYNADLTRTIPVSGRFSRRQRQVYNSVLRVLRAISKAATPGKLPKEWQKEAEALMQEELLGLGLLKRSQVRKQTKDNPALKEYFMHGVGHPLGLDVHDVGITVEAIQPGWVLTVEPGIYIPKEGFAVRLENNILVQEGENVNLFESVPIEADEIEGLISRKRQ